MNHGAQRRCKSRRAGLWSSRSPYDSFRGRATDPRLIVHDLNPRAMGPKVKGFVRAQSWFQDLTPVWVKK
jgi:hypothetical protein